MYQRIRKIAIMTVAVLAAMSIGIIAGCSMNERSTSSAASSQVSAQLPVGLKTAHQVNAVGTVEVAFSPNGAAADTVIKAIREAKGSIQVQAYSFTNKDIAQALVAAKKSGVDVRVILDKSQESEKYSSATFLANAGIPVRIDKAFAIAHSKVFILDGVNVITGSFNFTKAAQENNAENVLVLRGNKQLADLYVQNWQWRWNETEEYRVQ